MVDYKEGIRAQVRQLVSSLIPFDNLEREHIGFTQTWIDSGVEIFRLAKPANPPVHLVSYFVV